MARRWLPVKHRSAESDTRNRRPLGVITVEDWAEIRRLHRAEGVPIKEIARRLGVAAKSQFTSQPRAYCA